MSTLNLLARVTAQPRKEQELQNLLQEMLQPSRSETGCIRYDLFKARDKQGEFWFVEQWSSEAALDAHKQSEHYVRFREKLPDFAQGVEGTIIEQIG